MPRKADAFDGRSPWYPIQVSILMPHLSGIFAIADGVRYDVAFAMNVVIFHCLCFTLKHEKEVSSLSMQVMIDVVDVIVFVAVVPVVVELRNDRCDTNI